MYLNNYFRCLYTSVIPAGSSLSAATEKAASATFEMLSLRSIACISEPNVAVCSIDIGVMRNVTFRLLNRFIYAS